MSLGREHTLTWSQEARFIVWKCGHAAYCDQAYWRWCEEKRVPYVRVTTHRHDADVLMICSWLPLKLDQRARTQVKDLLKRFHISHSRNLFADLYVHIEGVGLEHAETFAKEVYTIGWDFGRRTEELVASGVIAVPPFRSGDYPPHLRG